MQQSNYTGRCFCGEVELSVSGRPTAMGFCHCASCRSWAAAPINAFTLWASGRVKVTRGEPGVFHKTDSSYRQFCRTCGGHLMTAHYPDNASNADAVAGELCPELKERVIPLGRPDTLLRVHECLERGEIVGILGDRALKSDKTTRVDFFGAPATFPQGPLLLASILKAPVVLFFGLYRGNRRYTIHFESFAEELQLERRERSAQLAPWVARYASRLEHYCRLAPFNWFNFYDFWRA
jgi:predicted LPLAT superfamily acyltransferase